MRKTSAVQNDICLGSKVRGTSFFFFFSILIVFCACHFLKELLFFPRFFVLIGGQLLYNVVVVSAIHQRESAICVPSSPPS